MSNWKIFISVLLALGLLGGLVEMPARSTQPSQTNAAAEKAAVAAAKTWLGLVDSGHFAESWQTAAPYFQAAIDQRDWETRLKAVRTPLGKVVSRKLKSQTYMTSLPGAPDGNYVVIQYQTVFEKKATAIETVTPMLDQDGKWKVSGYYIR